MSTTHSKDDILNLYQLAREQGMSTLSVQEQRVVRKAIQEHNLPSLEKPEYSDAMLHEATKEELDKLTDGIQFVSEVPPAITRSTHKRTYEQERNAMIMFRKPIVIRDNITHKQAIELMHHIRSGKSASFEPKGAFTAGRDTDPFHAGMYRVIAQYVGGDKK